ncbi:LOW QUALITY PROTEIN: E3 ubiquitin-protein ligase CHFR [Pholidichthys leucotaenia]
MDSYMRGRPWGKLVKVESSETVLLFERECTVGRKKGCYLSFPASKLVSGEHCKIVKDENSGLVWLEDTSTNGTVINMSKLVKKQTHMLQHGDVIYFVYRKHEPEQNIAYVYHAIKTEPALSQHGYSAERSAHSSSPVPDSEMALSVEPVMLSCKAPRDMNQEEPMPSTSASHYCIKSSSTSDQMATSASSVSGQAKDVTFSQEKETESLEPERKRKKISDDLYVPQTSSTDVAGLPTKSTGSASSKPLVHGAKTDKMEESLTCVICQDLLHDCVSLQPCMHVFCAACFGWMERSSFCPTCRCPVERIHKNRLNNLVEAYLIQHPEKVRSEEDLKSMDSRNKINDMLQPKVERSFSDEEGSSDYLFELSDSDSDSSETGVQSHAACFRCLPKPVTEEGVARSPVEEPSTSSDKPSAPQEYRCPPGARHFVCTCCLQLMPDRQAELNNQRCWDCQQPFCHMYWGFCHGVDCQGCLAPFSDLNLTDKCLDGVLNNNNYESEVLRNYLFSKGKSWKDLLHESLQGLQQGSYSLADRRISAQTPLCLRCGLRLFKELAYQYRQKIPASELPVAVTSRPDCYWGRNCRTQVKAHHAMKFNHICEQTRFKN